MLNTKNPVAARMGYQQVRQQIFDAWIKSFGGDVTRCWDYVDSLKLAPNTVRLENVLSPNTANYTFGVTPQQANNSGVQYRTEKRLNQTDTLIVTSYGILVGLPLTNDPNDVNWSLRTFANPLEFGTADAKLINDVIYSNSNLKVTVNNDILIPSADVFQNLFIPETQATSAPGAGSPLTEITGAEDGFVAVEPNIYLVGPRNSVLEVILPSSMTALAATNARIAIVLRGYLAQNSTVMA